MKNDKFPLIGVIIITILLLMTSCKKEQYSIVWSELTTATTSEINDVYFIHPDTGYAVGGTRWEHGEQLQTTDAGETWVSDTLTNNVLNCLSVLEDQYLHAGGYNGYFLSRTWSNPDWIFKQLPSNVEIHAITFYDENNGIAVGGGSFQIGVIYRFSSFGGKVDTLIEGINHELQDVCFLNSTEAIAVGYGAVYKTYNAGKNWVPKPVEGEFFLTVNFPTPQIGYAAGYTGTIIKTTDGGETWKKLRNGNKLFTKREVIRDIHFVSQDKGYLVGDDGVFWITENGGETWKFIEMPTETFNAIHLVDGVGYIAADNGRMFKFVD